MQHGKIGGLAVLYNPSMQSLVNILISLKDCAEFILIDNSDSRWGLWDDIAQEYPHVHYLFSAQNKGIAWALNEGVQYLAEKGCTWALTLDQDSTPPSSMPQNLLNKAKSHLDFSAVALISPSHNTQVKNKSSKSECEYPRIVMTSGNLLLIDVWQKIGGFEEKLFIDYVDFDYCLKLQIAGHKILQINAIELKHSLGNQKIHRIFGISLKSTHHNALRRYYLMRNALWVHKKYARKFPDFARLNAKWLVQHFIGILLFEAEKIAKIKMMLWGVYDFYKNIYGECQRI